jgi:hypothetical protein
MEPDFARLSTSVLEHGGDQARAWMHNSRLHYFAHHDPGVAPLSLADRLAGLRLLSIKLVTHIPSTLTAESFYRALLTEIPQKFPTSYQSHLNSLDKLLEHGLRNFWANLPHSWNAAHVRSMRGAWSDRPLIVVSAGPSLTDALPALGEVKGRAFLLATGTAARILMDHRIHPDMVVSVDPYEPNLEHFKGWDTSGVPLVYYHRIHRGIPASYSGPRFYFVMKEDSPIPLGNSQENSDFCHGGSVAFSALQLAHYLGANPIIFVGQDFAFRGGHTHAEGSVVDDMFNTAALPGDYFQVPGAGGNPVITSRVYYSYLLYMQDYLLDFARTKPEVKHINTSSTGAKILGMDYQAFAEVMEAHASTCRPSPEEIVASALNQNQPVPGKARKAAVDRWTADLDRLLARTGRLPDFDRLFAKFKTTSLYSPAMRSYDDVYYLYEARHRSEGSRVFLNRFIEHLQFVVDEMRRMSP